MSQEIVLFDHTVAENIVLGKEDATREENETAAKEAYAHDFIMQPARGYETRVGPAPAHLHRGRVRPQRANSGA